MLPSDPGYPIEPNVFAITYEISAVGLGQSFWSCEGHADSLGRLCRIPAVWFYAPHAVTVELLAQHVQLLEDRHQLTHAWRVTALIPGRFEIDCPTFALAPLVTLEQDVGPPRPWPKAMGRLAELRRDLDMLVYSLREHVQARALREIADIGAELSREPAR